MRSPVVRIAALVMPALLVACGQTGPLYLPGEAPQPRSSQPAPAETTADTAEIADSPAQSE
ncbi:hypothetical protein EY643_16485 [Halioglobus maricola]|uniref:Lipoprotein n=1 Tax=Halioglobus maricola TaxID=2601894 RepID=A0A5P9NMN7_9GAMM|nr:lipoprotein [Halioglobus maricola]QFU77123.1 hypothetical protein EY643_16485 [Halioglobus maricola]